MRDVHAGSEAEMTEFKGEAEHVHLLVSSCPWWRHIGLQAVLEGERARQ
jgi:hypothetical protein